jgi:LmbE family N-acetylglucosaminyl deacetylase
LNILVLSPHRDDAAFSLALSITRWRASGHRVTILNLFSRSLHAPFSDVDTVHENDRLTYVSALRRREDESFARQIPGLAMVDVNLKDAPIRLRCDPASVWTLPVDPNDASIPKIRKAITNLAEGKAAFGALVLPLGLAGHIDHRVVREAALPLYPQLPRAFYEELPYAARPEAIDGLADPALSSQLGEPLTPVYVHGTAANPAAFKRRVAGIYASQISDDEVATIASFGQRYHDAERLWANPAWVAALVPQRLGSLTPELADQPLSA